MFLSPATASRKALRRQSAQVKSAHQSQSVMGSAGRMRQSVFDLAVGYYGFRSNVSISLIYQVYGPQ